MVSETLRPLCRHGRASARRGRAPGERRAPRCASLAPSKEDQARRHLLEPGLCLQGAGKTGCRNWPLLNSGVRITCEDERHAEPADRALLRRRRARVREIHRPLENAGHARADLHSGRKRRHRRQVAIWWNDSYRETVLPVTNNIPPARRRRIWPVSRRADPCHQQLCAQCSGPPRKERSTSPATMRVKADLRAVSKGAGPEILKQTRTTAGLVRVRPAVEAGQRKLANGSREPRRGPADRQQDHRGRTGARGTPARPAN